jgi:hypothetical protein
MIRVWADRLADVGNLSKQVGQVLTNDLLTDGTNSMFSQGVVFKGVDSRKVDVPVNNYDEPLKVRRVSNITASGKYVGA